MNRFFLMIASLSLNFTVYASEVKTPSPNNPLFSTIDNAFSPQDWCFGGLTGLTGNLKNQLVFSSYHYHLRLDRAGGLGVGCQLTAQNQQVYGVSANNFAAKYQLDSNNQRILASRITTSDIRELSFFTSRRWRNFAFGFELSYISDLLLISSFGEELKQTITYLYPKVNLGYQFRKFILSFHFSPIVERERDFHTVQIPMESSLTLNYTLNPQILVGVKIFHANYSALGDTEQDQVKAQIVAELIYTNLSILAGLAYSPAFYKDPIDVSFNNVATIAVDLGLSYQYNHHWEFAPNLSYQLGQSTEAENPQWSTSLKKHLGELTLTGRYRF